MRQPDNLPAFCRVHRTGRPLIGMCERGPSLPRIVDWPWGIGSGQPGVRPASPSCPAGLIPLDDVGGDSAALAQIDLVVGATDPGPHRLIRRSVAGILFEGTAVIFAAVVASRSAICCPHSTGHLSRPDRLSVQAAAPVPAPFQPYLAGPRRPRRRPDEVERLNLTADAAPLRRKRPQRPSPPHLRPHHERQPITPPHRPPRLSHPRYPTRARPGRHSVMPMTAWVKSRGVVFRGWPRDP